MSAYLQARDDFRVAAAAAGFSHEALPIKARGPEDEALTVDVASRGEGERALLCSSGLHGVEAHAGSAVQRALLRESREWPGEVRVVFVHVVNPWGMAWNRRVNENNVDLNRNFRDWSAPVPTTPSDYDALYRVLHPPGEGGWDPGLLLRVMLRGLWRGPSRVKQAITGGQYTRPDGLFYGGGGLEEGPRVISDWLQGALEGCARVFALDIHTGLGTRGEDTFLSPYSEEDPRSMLLTELFGFRVFPMSATASGAYDIEGGLCRLLPELTTGEVTFVTQEHGTVSPVEVLVSLVREHQAHRAGAGPEHPDKARLLRAFTSDPARTLERGRAAFDALLSALTK